MGLREASAGHGQDKQGPGVQNKLQQIVDKVE